VRKFLAGVDAYIDSSPAGAEIPDQQDPRAALAREDGVRVGDRARSDAIGFFCLPR
jgi:hypothetical protein